MRGGTDGEKINDESFPQDEQFDYDEQPQHFDDDGANGFPEEDGVRRRESYLSEDEHDPSQPALEEDDEALLDAVVLFFSFVLFKSASPPHELKPPKAEFEPPNIIFM